MYVRRESTWSHWARNHVDIFRKYTQCTPPYDHTQWLNDLQSPSRATAKAQLSTISVGEYVRSIIVIVIVIETGLGYMSNNTASLLNSTIEAKGTVYRLKGLGLSEIR